jgi:hypothetical protein
MGTNGLPVNMAAWLKRGYGRAALIAGFTGNTATVSAQGDIRRAGVPRIV